MSFSASTEFTIEVLQGAMALAFRVFWTPPLECHYQLRQAFNNLPADISKSYHKLIQS